MSGEAFDIATGTVDFSLGVEWRYASADFVPDAFLSSGDVVGFNPGQPTGGSVTAREVFGELRVPILVDRPWVQNLAANGGFRFSDYDLDGVGGVWTYLYGADWRVNPDFAFRTSWTYTDEFTTTPVQALPAIQNECVGAYGTTCGEPIPELKSVSRLTWNNGPASFTLRHRFIDEVTVETNRKAQMVRRPVRRTFLFNVQRLARTRGFSSAGVSIAPCAWRRSAFPGLLSAPARD